MATRVEIEGSRQEEKSRYAILDAARVSALAVVAVPCLVFLVHAMFFNWYVVDDAGIAFAYARNLAHGFGLVAQPGLSPVEGYSDFAWVGLLSPFFALNLFDPHLTPKLLSGALVLAAFVVLARGLTRYYKFSAGQVTLALTLLSLNSGFVVWTTSGLENPLYALVVAGLIYILGRGLANGWANYSDALAAGLLAAIAGMTRPDGAVFAAAYPLAALLLARESKKTYLMRVAANLAAFGAMYGSFVLFRVLYFGDIVPNTFHAKFSSAYGGAESLPGKALELFYGMAAGMSVPLLLLVLAAIILLIVKRAFSRELFFLGVMTALGAAIYVALPEDIMGNYRFATPFFVCFFPFLVLLIRELIGLWSAEQAYKVKATSYAVIVAVLVFWTVGMLASSDYESKAFAPFDDIARQFGFRFNDYAQRLGVSNGSVLVPDMGGTLYYSDLKVYDLGMLTDRTIAATAIDDKPAFYDYIFDKAKPTFINTHHRWTLMARLDDDPRFRRDYVPLYEEIDPVLKAALGVNMYSGDYVRKDAVSGKEQVLNAIREELSAEKKASIR